jgi:hypothetical protein
LGQVAFNPSANLVPGQTYTFNFTISQSLIGGAIQAGPSVADATQTLNAWQPFASGALVLNNVSVGAAMSVTVTAGPGSDVLTLGNVEASIADTINAESFGYTLVPADAPGLGTTTFWTQFEQTPTPSWWDILSGSGMPWWGWVAIVGGGGILLLVALK